MIRVAIIDDHPLARRGLESILSEADDLVVMLSVAEPDHLVSAIGDSGEWPDVVLLDLYLRDSTPCLAAITDLRTVTKVIVVSVSANPDDVLSAIRAGVFGYVTKLTEPDMLLLAVRTVAGGGFALSPQLADILHSELATGRIARHGDGPGLAERDRPAVNQAIVPQQPVALSAREEETLDLIARGFTHNQVATRLGVSSATVNTYVERIRAKLQVGNKAELTRAALERSQRHGQP
jgi:DNA-binding NarL/FixJ family response regulator